MAKTIQYVIRNQNGEYLQGVEINERYSKTGTAPTMGNLHTPCEYTTLWGYNKITFEPLTLVNYIKILLEEYRWENKLAMPFAVLPWSGKGEGE